MDGIDLLRREALARRNAVILAAKREYQATLREIGLLSKRLNLKRRGRPPKIASVENALLRPTTVARQILDDGKPMTLVELTIEVQRRGCRPLDHPSIVAKAIDAGLRSHGKRYRKNGRGRWATVS